MAVTDGTVRLRHAEEIVSCNLDGGSALLDMSTSNYYKLNNSAAMIWQFIGDGATVSSLIERMLAEFEVEREQCAADVESVVASFMEAGLVVQVD